MITDIIICLLVLIFASICGLRGFLRSALKLITSFIALIAAIFLAQPVAVFLNDKFGWAGAMDAWFENVPMITGAIALYVFTAIALFIVIRIVLLFVDKFFVMLRKSAVIRLVDRILGFVFGLALGAAIVFGLMLLLPVIEGLPFMPDDLTNMLFYATDGPNANGLIGKHVYQFMLDFIAPTWENITATVSAAMNLK
ncbi:MAG: CvpA family protein [Christensenellaceae bacterium]|jgi:uncharacterized membrane protein required for colicin V production|nr:CvpA family protein [Christensenellaceae bacterium]